MRTKPSAPTSIGSARCSRRERTWLEGWQLHDADQHNAHAHQYGQDPGVSLRANEAQVLWYLGYVDRARAKMSEALATAEDHRHTASIAYALIFTSGLYQQRATLRRR